MQLLRIKAKNCAVYGRDHLLTDVWYNTRPAYRVWQTGYEAVAWHDLCTTQAVEGWGVYEPSFRVTALEPSFPDVAGLDEANTLWCLILGLNPIPVGEQDAAVCQWL